MPPSRSPHRSPTARRCAAHWSSTMGAPGTAQDGRHASNVGEQTITIVSTPGLTRERLDAMVLVVRGATDIVARARQMGLETHENALALCGMWMRVREEAG